MRAASESELGTLVFKRLKKEIICVYIMRFSAGSDGWRLYDYITRHFIATVSPDCKYLQTTISFSIATETFTCTGKTLISAGAYRHEMSDTRHGRDCVLIYVVLFKKGCMEILRVLVIFLSVSGYTEVMTWHGIPQEEALPVCERGDTFTVDEIKLLEKQTNPPDYLTEAELITLMEKHGIGAR